MILLLLGRLVETHGWLLSELLLIVIHRWLLIVLLLRLHSVLLRLLRERLVLVHVHMVYVRCKRERHSQMDRHRSYFVKENASKH